MASRIFLSVYDAKSGEMTSQTPIDDKKLKKELA